MPATSFSDSGVDPTRVESDTPMFAGPSFAGGRSAGTRAARRSNMAPIAVGAGLVLLAGLAAVGWYATQPHDQGVAQVTPGVAIEPAPASAPAGQLAQNTPTAPDQTLAVNPKTPAPAPAAAPASAHRTTKATPARAVSRSATASGVNASATLPAAPQSYSGAAAPSPKVTAPVAQTPAPAPVNPAPAESAPLPTETAPTTQPPPQ